LNGLGLPPNDGVKYKINFKNKMYKISQFSANMSLYLENGAAKSR